jgi:hypothetical protein
MGLTPSSGFLQQSRSDDARHGNFEVVVPDLLNGGLSHYWRNNGGDGRWVPPKRPIGTRMYTSTSLAESDYKFVADNVQGNLELLARPDERVGHPDFAWRENGRAWAWHGPFGTALPRGVAGAALVAERRRTDVSALRAVVPVPRGGFVEYARLVDTEWEAVDRFEDDVLQGVRA